MRPARILIAIAAFLPAIARADEPVVWKVMAGYPGVSPRHLVDAIGEGGVIRLKPSGAAFPLIQRGPTEGAYLLVTRRPDAASPVVLRVEVAEIAADGLVALTTAPEAAAQLKAGDPVELARPPGSTTAQIRALPAVVAAPGEDAAEAARQAAARIRSINNLKQIGLAMHNFESTYGCLPPAVIFGPDGKPWHSWRVLLLPFLEYNDFYKRYDFSQPWDSETNRKLLDGMPEIYRDPTRDEPKGHFTHYAVPVGANAMFSPDGPRMKVGQDPPIGEGGTRFADVIDGLSWTVLAVPIDPKAAIPWTKPEDLPVAAEFPGIGRPGGIPATHRIGDGPEARPGAPILFGDGRVRVFDDATNTQILSAMLTRNGGELIPPTAMPAAPPRVANPDAPNILTIRVDGGHVTVTVE